MNPRSRKACSRNRRATLEILELEARCVPTAGVFNEDFSDDVNALVAGFDTAADGVRIDNDLPRYGSAVEGPTGRAGYYSLHPGTPGDPGWGLHASGQVLSIVSSFLGVPQVTFTVGQPTSPGGTGDIVSGLGLSVRGDGRVMFTGTNGSLSFTIGFTDAAPPWQRLAVDQNDLLPSGLEIGPLQSVSVFVGEIMLVDNVTAQIEPAETNQPPVANPDLVLVDRHFGESVVFFPLENDFDPNNDPFQLISFTTPAHGSVTTLNGGLRYRASAAALADPTFRQDSFSYTVRDSQGAASTSTVTLQLNFAPVAFEDEYITPHNSMSPFAISPALGVLANDNDSDGDLMSVRLTTAPQFGTVVLNPNGSFTYTSTQPGGRIVADSFWYSVTDPWQTSDAVRVRLRPSNQSPVAANGLLVGDHGVSAPLVTSISYFDLEGDIVTAQLVDSPVHGIATFAVAPGQLNISYQTPTGVVLGPDHFTYRLFDGTAFSDTYTIDVRVPNHPPVAVTDHLGTATFQLPVESSLTTHTIKDDRIIPIQVGAFTVLISGANPITPNSQYVDDFDLDADRLTFTFGQPHYGTLVLANGVTGDFTYDIPPGLAFPQRDLATGAILPDLPLVPYGFDWFDYQVSDGHSIDSGTVWIDLIAAAGHPTDPYGDLAYSLVANHPLRVDEENGLKIAVPFAPTGGLALFHAPQHGSVELDADGGFLYRPAPGFVGADHFDVLALHRISDGPVSYDVVLPSTVTLFVLDNPPEAHDDHFLVAGDRQKLIPPDLGLLANDLDADGHPIRVQFISPPAHGRIVTRDDYGGFTYLPDPGFRGLDTFHYVVSDGFEFTQANITMEVTDPGLAGDYATVYSPTGLRFVLATDPGTTLANVSVTGTPPGTPPPGLSFPFGYVQFEVRGIPHGGQATVRFLLPDDSPAVSEYWKFDASATPSDSWYPYRAPFTEFLPGEIRLHLQDGLFGDNDHAADGVIRDPGGPAQRLTPQVDRIVLNGNQQQRSRFVMVQVYFTDLVTLDRNTFELFLNNRRFAVRSFFTSTIDAKTVATLQFAAKSLPKLTLPEGRYRLVTRAAAVHSRSGLRMDADHTDLFFRLFGDVNGDGVVNGSDQAPFDAALGSTIRQARYRAYLDYDGNGRIDAKDRTAFRARIGRKLA